MRYVFIQTFAYERKKKRNRKTFCYKIKTKTFFLHNRGKNNCQVIKIGTKSHSQKSEEVWSTFSTEQWLIIMISIKNWNSSCKFIAKYSSDVSHFKFNRHDWKGMLDDRCWKCCYGTVDSVCAIGFIDYVNLSLFG